MFYRRIPWFVFALAALVVIINLRAAAQSRANAPVFETASVKRNTSNEPFVGIGVQPGGLFTARNVTLQLLIQNANRVQAFQVVGGPDWLRTERFDVVGKSPANAGPADVPLMVRSLLAERFSLSTHPEVRQLPVFALALARNDRRFGPQLRSASAECTLPENAQPQNCWTHLGRGQITAGGITMTRLAALLSSFTSRKVIDRTGVTGTFHIDLQWTPDPSEGTGPLGPLPTGPATDAPTSTAGDRPSISTAIQEQLGLKLDSARGPVDVLVIDHVEHPTEN
jgi:uncharacterized protein (TIGR03435 family)